MSFTISNDWAWLPHFAVDYEKGLWHGLHDKRFWDVNWSHAMYPYNNQQERKRMEMHYNMMINDYRRGTVNTHSFTYFPCSCESQNKLPDKYIFPPLDAVCNDDWMFEVIREIAVPYVNVVRRYINSAGGVILDNGEILDHGNTQVVGPYDKIIVILMDSQTLYHGRTLPLTLAECVAYLAYHMNIIDALKTYNHCVT